MLTAAHIAELTSAVGPSLYHLTDASNVPAILASGLLPGQDSQFTPDLVRPGVVYLCTQRIAQIAMSFDEAWGDAVFAIDLCRLDPAHFVGDEENWRDPDATFHQSAAELVARYPDIDNPTTLIEHLQSAGTIGYASPINPADLGLVYVTHRHDLPAVMDQAAALGTPPTPWQPGMITL